MIRSVVKWPDSFLLDTTPVWEFNNPIIPYDQLEQDLIDTMTFEKGIGLAANQIGISARVLAIYIQKDKHIRIMYNPEILYHSEDMINDSEGCLSFPDTFLEIPRYKSVTVRWLDRHQYIHSMDLTDIDARCILHEIDHLNGKVFKDYVSDLKFRRAWSK